MSVRHSVIPILTDGSGNCTAYSPEPHDGTILAIRALLGTLASGAVDITITDAASGLQILAITNLAADSDYYPRGAAVNPSNAAITNSFARIPVSGLVKVVVAQGTAAKSGTIHVWSDTETAD